jgi:hypothetical protein
MDALIRDIRPGAAELRTTAPTVERVTRTLNTAAPVATAALTQGQRAAPSIDRLLRYGTPFMSKTGSVLGDLAPMVACIRPYGPEIAGQMGTWTGFQANYDPTAHYTRVVSQRPPFTAGTALTSEQIVNGVFRNKFFYAMPRPPGLNAGQPWLLPQCGAGADAVDVTKDPELHGSGG